MISPRVQVLEKQTIERVIDEAYQLLMDPGVMFDTEPPLRLLAEAGADVDFSREIVRIPARLIDEARKTPPAEIVLYDLSGRPRLTLGGDNFYFYPTSTAMTVWDYETNTLRPPLTPDMVKFIKVAEGLPHCDALSSTFFCHDVPGEVADSYRIYLLLKYATKPFVTGAYSVEGQRVEFDLLEAFRGGPRALAEKPLAVMTACPSPVLQWSMTAEFIMMCAEAMVPIGIGPMPLAGGNGPATLIGTLVQHTAEALSGLVLSQVAKPGAPVLWMSPTGVFDMRQFTSLLGAIETHMISCGANEIGKYLNLPTFNYLGVSDSKMVDAQQAMETTQGIMMAALSRSNLNGSLGMLNFESAQSFEGLVISHEAAGMVRRLVRGIDDGMDNLGSDIIRQVGFRGDFLSTEHTLRWFKKEFYYPDIIDRRGEEAWKEAGSKSMLDRAREKVKDLVDSYEPHSLPEGVGEELDVIMQRAAAAHGMERLPSHGD
jgi:trimethylamine--corrinoid protein Co-methyltransferase